MQNLILASRNKDKIKELRLALKEFEITLKSSYDFDELREVKEDKETLKGNALKKARYTHEMTGLPVLADDTGLEVDALDGRPGVYSARYAGENVSYEENVAKLLDELAGVAIKDRGAQFRTVVAFITESQTVTFEGVCRGTILAERFGVGGFGYDPVFQPRGYSQTFAQLSEATKNDISHRGKAVAQFIDWLRANSFE